MAKLLMYMSNSPRINKMIKKMKKNEKNEKSKNGLFLPW